MQALEYACLPVFEGLVSLAKEKEPARERALGDLKAELDRFEIRAKKLGCSDQDIEDAKYALVALVDERVPEDCPNLRLSWRNALQQLCYGENTAGERFFYRLNDLLKEPRRQHAARIYALALAFGFSGVYQDEAQLAKLRVGVRRYLGLPSKTLPMNPPPAKEPLRRRGRRRNFAVIWSAAAVLCAGIFATALVRKKLTSETNSIVRSLSTLPNIGIAR